jgi:hypothetical protein
MGCLALHTITRSSAFAVLIFVSFLTTAFAQQDTIVVSERVGKVIDAREREYFGLFPDVEDFVKLYVLSSTKSDNYDAILETTIVEEILHLSMTQKELVLLRQFIDRYEEIRVDRPDSEVDKLKYWYYKDLYYNEIARYPELIDSTEVSLEWTLRGGTEGRRTGLLLFSYSAGIYYSHTLQLDDILNPMFLPVRDIDSITYTANGSFWTGMAIGAGIGAFAGSTSLFPEERDTHQPSPWIIIPLVTVVGGVIFGLPLGIITAIQEHSAITSIEGDLEYWRWLLPELQEHQFFNHGLPPELYKKLNAQ